MRRNHNTGHNTGLTIHTQKIINFYEIRLNQAQEIYINAPEPAILAAEHATLYLREQLKNNKLFEPIFIKALCCLSSYYLGNKNFEQAIESYNELINHTPKHQIGYEGLFQACEGLYNYCKEVNDYNDIITNYKSFNIITNTNISKEIKNFYGLASFEIGYKHEKNRNYQAALNSYTEAEKYLLIKQDILFENIANTYQKLIKTDPLAQYNSMTYYEKAAELQYKENPVMAAHNYIKIAYFKEKSNPEDAAHTYIKAAKLLEPKSALQCYKKAEFLFETPNNELVETIKTLEHKLNNDTSEIQAENKVANSERIEEICGLKTSRKYYTFYSKEEIDIAETTTEQEARKKTRQALTTKETHTPEEELQKIAIETDTWLATIAKEKEEKSTYFLSKTVRHNFTPWKERLTLTPETYPTAFSSKLQNRPDNSANKLNHEIKMQKRHY